MNHLTRTVVGLFVIVGALSALVGLGWIFEPWISHTVTWGPPFDIVDYLALGVWVALLAFLAVLFTFLMGFLGWMIGGLFEDVIA